MPLNEQTTEDRALTKLLHILALCSFAVSQPFYSLVASDATFLVAQDASPAAIVLLALNVSFAVPVVLFLPVLVLNMFSSRLSKIYMLAVVIVLASLIFLPVSKSLIDTGPYIQLATAALIGGGAGYLYHRYHVARFYLSCVSFAVVVFPLWFLFATPVNSLLSSSQSQAEDFANNGTNIVFIIFDEMPLTSLVTTAGNIDQQKFPNFGYLASTSHWFRNASTVSYFTNIAVPAMLSGRYPTFQPNSDGELETPIPSAENHPKNLFSLVQNSHEISAIESITQLQTEQSQSSPSRNLSTLKGHIALWLDSAIIYLNIVLPENWLPWLPGLAGKWTNFANSADNLTEDAESKSQGQLYRGRSRRVFDFMGLIKKAGSPQLLYLHVQLPHVPLVFLPSGKYYGPVDTKPHGMGMGGWSDDPLEASQAYQRHLLQLAYVDVLLGEIFDKLKREKLFDESIVIVTSDHGESFKENTHARLIRPPNLEDTLMVPLFVKLPQQIAGEISDRNVEIIDILPTLSQLIESEDNWSFDGQNLFSETNEKPEKTVYYHTGEIRSFRASDVNIETSLQRKAGLFGEGGINEVYRHGPNGDLITQSVSDLTVSAEDPETVSVTNNSDYLSVNLSDTYIPALLRGRFDSDELEYPLDLAIVLNGSVTAVTRTFTKDDHAGNFSALIPESSFVDGTNDLSIYIVKSEGNSLIMQPTAIK